MVFYTSDLHFGHRNCLKFDNRPFADVAEMDRELILRWNSRVRPEDDIYVLGDFSYKSGRDISWYLQQLNGHKHLVIGNHDKKLLSNAEALKYFETVEHIGFVKDCEYQVVLCHYPMAEWEGKRHGYLHLYGHIHGNPTEGALATKNYMTTQANCYNVGCMLYDYFPQTLLELIVKEQK